MEKKKKAAAISIHVVLILVSIKMCIRDSSRIWESGGSALRFYRKMFCFYR